VSQVTLAQGGRLGSIRHDLRPSISKATAAVIAMARDNGQIQRILR